MKKRILCLSLVFVSLISIVFSSFSVVYADDFDINDYIEVHRPEIPKVDNNGDLLQDDIDTSFDDEFYNSPDEIDDSEKDFETFEKKQSYSTGDNTSSNNINTDVDSNKSSAITKKSLFKSSRTSTSSVNDESEISTLSEEAPNPFDSTSWNVNSAVYSFVVTPENALACFLNGFNFVANLPQYKFNFDGDGLISLYPDLFNLDNLIIYRFIDPYKVYNSDYHEYYYGFIYTDSDLHFTSVNPGVSKFDATYCNFTSSPNLTEGNVFSAVIATYKNKLSYSSFNYQFPNIDYEYYSGNTFYCGENTDFSIVYNGGNHKIFIDDQEVSTFDPDNPTYNTDIVGEITAEDKTAELNWKAYPKKEITDNAEYDVRLFAVDLETAPKTLTKDMRYVDLSDYSPGGIIKIDNQIITSSCDLEAIYYYIHQMKAYDDSEESVIGYKFDEFEIRNTCTFVLAFKKNGIEEDYTVCSCLVYNYEYIIDNVMGDYSVKKDYEDFPDINDYIENFPSVEDFLPDGEDPGPIDWILAYIKWIGACIKTFGNNFIGFFKWLKDCVPVAWKNLGIALYNLVCDLKSLLLYLFKPKTKSINTMVNKKIPGFINLKNSFNNTNKAKLPYLKLFGTKFGFDFSVIDSDTKSFLRTISSAIIYIVFSLGVINLIGKVFGFKISGSSDDSDEG